MFNNIKITSNEYPSLLKTIKKPPQLLYYYGNIFPYEALNKGMVVSIVGSRGVSDYGKRVIEKFIKDLLPYKPVIVSGYMYGCDYYAHYFALKYGLTTLAVIPCGVTTKLLKHSPDIYEDVLSNGCFISEYPGDAAPNRWDFVLRNRIIAGLSKKVFIVEAAEKSGTLTTANYAFSFGREVYICPTSIFNHNFNGVYSLYKRGAKFIKNGSEMFMGGRDSKTETSDILRTLPINEAEVAKLVQVEGRSIEQLCDLTKLEFVELTALLDSLVCKNLLVRDIQGVYRFNTLSRL